MAGAEVRVAVGDIGTNSTRLLIADVVGGRPTPAARRVVVTGLGAGVDREGRLAEAGIGRTLEVLAGYRRLADEAGAQALRMVATAAVRAATANGQAFLDRAAKVLGVRPEVISGEEEAALTFEGAVGSIAGRPTFLVIDVGGGSTEFVFGTTGPEAAASVGLGSRRITERFLPQFPAAPGEVAAARRAAGEAFATAALPGVPETVVGTGGTYTALGAIVLGLAAYDPETVHGSVVPLTCLDALTERLAAMTPEETAALPSLDPARAPVLLGGAVAAAEALRRSGREEIVVSEADLLDGIARRLAAV
ncbi:MAG: exopolyphosphatase [Acidimicrobiia bacterium]|nr:exopolyphosphatase [Acidimicrobiia bacterium]